MFLESFLEAQPRAFSSSKPWNNFVNTQFPSLNPLQLNETAGFLSCASEADQNRESKDSASVLVEVFYIGITRLAPVHGSLSLQNKNHKSSYLNPLTH